MMPVGTVRESRETGGRKGVENANRKLRERKVVAGFTNSGGTRFGRGVHFLFANAAVEQAVVLVFPRLGSIQQDDVNGVLLSDLENSVGNFSRCGGRR
jgi:hypothetical protein